MNPAKPLWPRATLIALTGINLFNYLDRYVLSAVLTPIKDELGLTDGELASLSTAFMLGYFVTSPLFGYLGDRAPRRWLVAGGIAVWSIGTVATGWAQTLMGLIAFRIMVGVGEASYATVSPAWISDLFPKGRRNNALTLFYVAIPVGSALGYLVGGLVAAHQGWRHAFYWAGAPGVVLALATLVLREPVRGAMDEGPAPAKPTLADYWSLRKCGDFLYVVAGYIAYTFALGAFAFWGPTFLHRIFGMPNEQASLFFGGTLVGAGLIGTFVGGFAATAWQKRNPAGYALTLGLSVAGSVPLAVAAFVATTATVSMVCMAGAMFLLFLSTGPVNTLILETVPAAMRASAMALSIFAIHLFGDLWSPQLVGVLSDSFGLQKAVLLLPGALAVSAVFWLWLVVRMRKPAV